MNQDDPEIPQSDGEPWSRSDVALLAVGIVGCLIIIAIAIYVLGL